MRPLRSLIRFLPLVCLLVFALVTPAAAHDLSLTMIMEFPNENWEYGNFPENRCATLTSTIGDGDGYGSSKMSWVLRRNAGVIPCWVPIPETVWTDGWDRFGWASLSLRKIEANGYFPGGSWCAGKAKQLNWYASEFSVTWTEADLATCGPGLYVTHASISIQWRPGPSPQYVELNSPPHHLPA